MEAIFWIVIFPVLWFFLILKIIFDDKILEFFKIWEVFVFFSENIYLAIILWIILWILIPYLFYKFFVKNIAKFIENKLKIKKS